MPRKRHQFQSVLHHQGVLVLVSHKGDIYDPQWRWLTEYRGCTYLADCTKTPNSGFVAERLNAPVLKTDVGKPTVSSNLTKPATSLKERWLSDGQHLPAKKASG